MRKLPPSIRYEHLNPRPGTKASLLRQLSFV